LDEEDQHQFSQGYFMSSDHLSNFQASQDSILRSLIIHHENERYNTTEQIESYQASKDKVRSSLKRSKMSSCESDVKKMFLVSQLA
jgi:hypothetical protein